jgi:hypothetical protein
MLTHSRTGVVPMQLAEGTLDARAPFDFAQTLRFVEAFTPAADEQRIEDGTLRKGIMIERTPEALSHLARNVYGENAGYWAYYLRNAGR